MRLVVVVAVASEVTTIYGRTWLSDEHFAKLLADRRWNGCNLPTWAGVGDFPEEPVLIPRGSRMMQDFVDQDWPSSPEEVVARHGDEVRQVRWPSGHNQFGGVYRLAKVQEYLLHEMHLPEGGLLFDAALTNDSAVRSKLVEPLASMAPMLSIGATRTGLPFHTHDTAWQSTIYGEKLWFMLPPLPDDGPEWLPQKSWANIEQSLARLMLPVNGTDDLITSGRLDWILSKYPSIRNVLRYCVVGPGDTIVVPCNWHHATINVGDVVAVGGQGKSRPCQVDRFSQATQLRKQAEELRKMGEYREVRDLQKLACDSNPFYYSCAFELALDEVREQRFEAALATIRVMTGKLKAWVDSGLLPYVVGAVVFLSYGNLAASIKTRHAHEMGIELLQKAKALDDLAPVSHPRLRIYGALHLPGSQTTAEARDRLKTAKDALRIIESHALTRLDSASEQDLEWLCSRHHLNSTGSKAELNKRLTSWRSRKKGYYPANGTQLIWYESERGKLVNIFDELRELHKMVDGFESSLQTVHTDL